MVNRPSFLRKVRKRDKSSFELVIPSKLLSMIGFQKHARNQESKVMDSSGNEAKLNMWINEKANLEIRNSSKGINNVNGIHVKRNVRQHGGSCVFGLEYRVLESFKERGVKIDGGTLVEIFPNTHGNIEIRFL